MHNTREKLIELMAAFYGVDPMYYGVEAHHLADHLIANGVTIPVRCKDCDYYEKEYRGFGFCKYFDIGRADNDFCSSCIRRE
jgi:hypothetical protein